jgi:hypothetical protein
MALRSLRSYLTAYRLQLLLVLPSGSHTHTSSLNFTLLSAAAPVGLNATTRFQGEPGLST